MNSKPRPSEVFNINNIEVLGEIINSAERSENCTEPWREASTVEGTNRGHEDTLDNTNKSLKRHIRQ